jgi:hypothetical protein
MTPAKVMRAYTDAGYSCVAWQVWLMPWSRCGCGRRAVWRWRKGRYIYAWFCNPEEGYQSRCVCDECWEEVGDSLCGN